MSDTREAKSGIGLGGILFVVFLVLKLTHVINWSWLWIAAPLWVPAAVFAVLFIVAIIIAAAAEVTE